MKWEDNHLWQINPMFREQALELMEKSRTLQKEHRLNAKAWLEVSDNWDDLPVRIEAPGIAIVTIDGPIVRSSWWYTSYETLCMTFDRLRASSLINAVVLRFNSPGGSASGIKECIDCLDQLATAKLTVAQVDGGCYSAAYMLASRCGSICCPSSDHIGNIGTVLSLYDYSDLFKQSGIRPVIKRTGPIKGIGILGDKISPAQDAFLQHLVDAHFVNFREAVITGRGMSDEEFDAVSDGRWWLGSEAVSLKVSDRVSTLKETIESIRSQLAG